MIYLDLLIIEDIILNYTVLISTSYLLNRITKIYKIISSSLIGAIPILFIFINLNKYVILFLTLIFMIITSLITFSYHDIIYTVKNIIYMFLISIFLAGSLYFINTNIFSFNNSYIINTLVLLILSPFITNIYIKLLKKLKSTYSNYYTINIYLKSNHLVTLNSYLDTGNTLKDPYTNRPIIIVNKNKIKLTNECFVYVPYNTINKEDLLECFYPKKVSINGINFKVLIGLTNDIGLEGIDCILNRTFLERI